MGRRRVRWRNVARLALLLAAGLLIATYRAEPDDRSRVPRPALPRAARLDVPRLADVPRLWRPKPAERRALKSKRPGLGVRDTHYSGRLPERPKPQTPPPQPPDPRLRRRPSGAPP